MDPRWIEAALIYVAAPLLVAWGAHRYAYRGAMAPLLWCASSLALFVLWGDASFDRAVLWRLPFDHPYVRTVALRFVLMSGALLVLARFVAPGELLMLPRQRPRLWLLLLLLYPVLSAVPQGIVWRVLFAHRYAPLFGDTTSQLVAAAAVFAFSHITYRNKTAIVITAFGGAMFFETYVRTQSMLLASAEHAAYGLLAFTAGLGKFLHMGARFGPRTPTHGMVGQRAVPVGKPRPRLERLRQRLSSPGTPAAVERACPRGRRQCACVYVRAASALWARGVLR